LLLLDHEYRYCGLIDCEDNNTLVFRNFGSSRIYLYTRSSMSEDFSRQVPHFRNGPSCEYDTYLL